MLNKMKSFSFTKHFKLFACISLLLVITGIVGLVLAPFGITLFNFDVDFTGGTSCNYNLHINVDRTVVENVSKIATEVTGATNVSVVSSNGGQGVLIKCSELDSETREALTEAVFSAYGMSATEESDVVINSVSPSVGSDLKTAAILASVWAVILILIYIAIRFRDFRSGLAAVVCLVHDLLVMLSMYIIFQIPFNTNFIAAALTILGYSINATIVVFDRIRENKRVARNEVFGQIVDRSVWDTFTRSLNTTITTLMVMVMLLILGVDSIRNFALPLCIGIVCGCYSSVFVAGPVWNLFKGKKG